MSFTVAGASVTVHHELRCPVGKVEPAADRHVVTNRGGAGMTDTARSVFTPVAIVADEVIDTARSSLVTVSPILAAGAAAANPVRLAAILQELAADAALTLAARSHDDFCAAMKAWGEDLVELATVVLTPLGAAGRRRLGAAGGARHRGAALQVPAPRVDPQPGGRHRRRPRPGVALRLGGAA